MPERNPQPGGNLVEEVTEEAAQPFFERVLDILDVSNNLTPIPPTLPEGVPLFELASNPTFRASRAEYRRLVGGMQMWEGGPPVPGWLKPGLFLRHARTSLLYVVSSLAPDHFCLRRPPGVQEDYITSDYLNLYDLWLGTDYFECDDCRRKPGSPTLCADCLERRAQFQHGFSMASCRLPKFCSTAYDGGVLLDPAPGVGDPPKPPPTRFDREDPL